MCAPYLGDGSAYEALFSHDHDQLFSGVCVRWRLLVGGGVDAHDALHELVARPAQHARLLYQHGLGVLIVVVDDMLTDPLNGPLRLVGHEKSAWEEGEFGAISAIQSHLLDVFVVVLLGVQEKK